MCDTNTKILFGDTCRKVFTGKKSQNHMIINAYSVIGYVRVEKSQHMQCIF